MTRLEQQLSFILEIDKEKNIFRQTHLSGGGRAENDAEHAWHMATMAWLLREYANEPVDIARVMMMCLIHDIVEIDAGDTYAYDPAGLQTQQAREQAAKERIYALLPEDQRAELTALFDEFEAWSSPEARFAHVMDNLQPLLLNNSNGGADWKAHGVKAAQVRGRQGRNRLGSERLGELTESIIAANVAAGILPEE
ncbi:putative hydrolases of HD superfamily [Bacteroidales bacterium WCE2004]|nr:putative hydrolases of HD superfamily [Bacteroidales bacterium WCE2004]